MSDNAGLFLYLGPSHKGLNTHTVYPAKLHFIDLPKHKEVNVELLMPPFMVYTYPTMKDCFKEWQFQQMLQ